jgi:antirestriction protein ArdC
LYLSLAGCESPWWLTFKQAKDRHARVRRGARGRTIVKWTHTRRRLSELQAAQARATGQRVQRDEHGAHVLHMAMRHYLVFNAEQIDGVEDLTPSPATRAGSPPRGPTPVEGAVQRRTWPPSSPWRHARGRE